MKVSDNRADGPKEKEMGLIGGGVEESATVDRSVHTPGPWCVKRRFDVYEDTQKHGIGGTYIGTTRNREFVATTRGNGELPESVNLRCEADARLIAAAPDLLAACRDMIEAMEDYECTVDDPPTPKHREMMLRAMSAVEKATHQVA